MNKRWALMQRLSGYFLDVLQGLPTLRIFGRAQSQVGRVRTLTESWRKATMGTLSIAFLSALVLESLASLALGCPRGSGHRNPTGPGNHDPSNRLCGSYHRARGILASAGVGNMLRLQQGGAVSGPPVMDVIDGGPPHVESRPAGRMVDLRGAAVELSNVTCIYSDRGTGIVEPLTASIAPATTTVVTGPSGAGKSTLLSLFEQFISPTSGAISVDGVSIADLDIDGWRRHIGWVPQRPAFFAGSVGATFGSELPMLVMLRSGSS